jgi:23S rRNA pseudouridine2605 synthase
MNKDENKIRIQKILSQHGVSSRRGAEKLILEKKVFVNGKLASLGDKASFGDKIIADGVKVNLREGKPSNSIKIIIYNKPIKKICTRNDPQGRKTVFEDLPNLSLEKWISIGRLDFMTSGLLLFTNNGDFANKMMHPSSNVVRVYIVKTEKKLSHKSMHKMQEGISLDGSFIKCKKITINKSLGGYFIYKIDMATGQNREVRRLFLCQGSPVIELKRIKYDEFTLPNNLKEMDFVLLNQEKSKKIAEKFGVFL